MLKIFEVKRLKINNRSKEVFLETVASFFLFILFLLLSLKVTDLFLVQPTQESGEGRGEMGPGRSFREIIRLVYYRGREWSVVEWREFFSSELAAVKKFLSYGDLKSFFLETQLLGGVTLAIASLFIIGLARSLGTSKSREKVLGITRITLALSFILTVLVMSVSPFFFEDLRRIFLAGKAFNFWPKGFWLESFYPILINELVAVLALATFLAWAAFGVVCFLTRKKS